MHDEHCDVAIEIRRAGTETENDPYPAHRQQRASLEPRARDAGGEFSGDFAA